MGKPLSEEHKRKISESRKGKPSSNKGKAMSEEQKRKISDTKKRKYKENPEAWIKTGPKISKALTGSKRSEETKRKMSEAAKKRWQENPRPEYTEEQKEKLRQASKKYWAENPKAKEHRQNIIKAQGDTWKGKKHSEEAKTKISNYASNRTDEHKQQIAEGVKRYFDKHPEARKYLAEINIGKKASEETKRKLSEMRKGSGNPAWVNGSSFEPYAPEFNDALKEMVKEIHNHVCKLCDISEQEHFKKYGFRLSVHHIDYDKKNNNLTNLIPLCVSCNSKVNVNRNHWLQYFRSTIN